MESRREGLETFDCRYCVLVHRKLLPDSELWKTEVITIIFCCYTTTAVLVVYHSFVFMFRSHYSMMLNVYENVRA